jgi:hypothetical protein
MAVDPCVAILATIISQTKDAGNPDNDIDIRAKPPSLGLPTRDLVQLGLAHPDVVVRENSVRPYPSKLARLHDTLGCLMETLVSALIAIIRAVFLTRTNLALENAALRQQLVTYQRTRGRAQLRRFCVRTVSASMWPT